MKWGLIELAKNPEKQRLLRQELSQFETSDPTWEQLIYKLPYLNGVIQETLRLHPPLDHLIRTATQDDVLPLSKPIRTVEGKFVSELVVAKGTALNLPLAYFNRAYEIWGPDAKDFKPERWVEDGLTDKAKGIQGYHNIMSFSDGPRLCLGRNFASASLKASQGFSGQN